MIWGTGQTGMGVYDALRRLFPAAEYAGAIDSYGKGTFFGKAVEKPSALKTKYQEACVMVACYNGREEIQAFLEEIGKIENEDYILLGTSVG